MKDRLGVYAGFLGDPLPAQIGINIGLNLADYMRITAGYGTYSGEISSLQGYALGSRAFVPDWDFSPTMGLGLGSVSFDGNANGSTSTLQGVSKSGSFLFLTVGVDWQIDFGLYLAAGINISNGQPGASPFVDVGWFF